MKGDEASNLRRSEERRYVRELSGNLLVGVSGMVEGQVDVGLEEQWKCLEQMGWMELGEVPRGLVEGVDLLVRTCWRTRGG